MLELPPFSRLSLLSLYLILLLLSFFMHWREIFVPFSIELPCKKKKDEKQSFLLNSFTFPNCVWIFL